MWRCNCRLLILSILVVCLQRQFLVSEEEWFQADFFSIPCLAKASYAVFLFIWTLLNWQCKIFCRKNIECYSMRFKSEHFPIVLSCETLLFFFFSVFHSEDWSQSPECVLQVCCLGFFSLSERNFYECHLFCLYSLCRCMFTFITHTVQPCKVSWDLLRFQKKEKINFKSPEKGW